MSTTASPPSRATPRPLPDNFVGVQPGGGFCHRVELAWGRWRRAWLKRFRPRYVAYMAERRRGSPEGAPHEILDPRDLKDCRNQCSCAWDEQDNPFRWRRRVPFACWGAAELVLMALPLFAASVALAWLAAAVPALWWLWCVLPCTAAPLALIVYFFRDPPRRVPDDPGLVVAPADGTIAEITRLPHDEFIGGPAVRIGIFLSIFNVHLNRAPVRSRVIELQYHPGEFLNALRAESAIRNENTWIGLEEEDPPHRKLVVRQISGAIARRIVCGLRPGEVVGRGAKFGMIKLGSRTELILADRDGLEVAVTLGQRVRAGTTIMARFSPPNNG